MSIVRWNLKEAGCWKPTNLWANLWPNGQKPHRRLHIRVSLPVKIKFDSYTGSCSVNAADRWKKRNVWYSRRSVRNTPRGVTVMWNEQNGYGKQRKLLAKR